MSDYRYVVLGGGVAGGHAACELATRNAPEGSVCLVSAEKRPPYYRPALSKAVLKGETESLNDILIRDRDFYRRNGIELRLDTRISEVDLDRQRLRAGSQEVRFDKLLIATGAEPRRLQVAGADLKGIYYLRSSQDAASILGAEECGNKVVVFGGGFVGSEVAASLAEGGATVTLAFPEARLLQDRPFSPEMSEFFEAYFRRRGVEVLAGERLSAFHGGPDVSSVSMESGRTLPTDYVVMGVGVVPNTALFTETELEIDDGIVVDSALETNVDGVFAAGDVARFPDSVFDTRRRIEHWDNARRQGRHAARSMLGNKEPYRCVQYYFSDAFDLSWEFWGDRRYADQVVYRGSIDDGSFSTWWLRRRAVVAAFVMDRSSQERDQAPKLIESGQRVDPLRLSDGTIPLEARISDTSERRGGGFSRFVLRDGNRPLAHRASNWCLWMAAERA